MKTKLLNAGKKALFILPIILGVYGLHGLGKEPLNDALFNTLLMYVFCYAESPENWAVEAARWLAPLMTASGILAIVHSLQDRIRHYFLYKRGKSIVVYGPDDEKEPLLQDIGRSGISGSDAFIPASKYILLDDEQTNFAFTLQKTAIEQNAVADSGISDTVESSEANTFDILDSIFGDSDS